MLSGMLAGCLGSTAARQEMESGEISLKTAKKAAKVEYRWSFLALFARFRVFGALALIIVHSFLFIFCILSAFYNFLLWFYCFFFFVVCAACACI